MGMNMGDVASSTLSGAGMGTTIAPGIGTLIGGGIGLLAGLGKGFFGKKQIDLAGKINPNLPKYTTSPYAQQSLGAAQMLFNGRMPGAAAAQAKLLQSQGNTIANAQRGSTDASQLLAVGSGAQAGTDAAVVDLASQEGQYKSGLLDNLQNAYGQLTGEYQKEYNSQLQKYGIDVGAKTDLMNAGVNNAYGAGGDVSSLLGLLDQSGVFSRNKKSTGIGGNGFNISGSNPSLSNLIMRIPKFS